jgi:uncharacterized protein YecT (DUF1311 family)
MRGLFVVPAAAVVAFPLLSMPASAPAGDPRDDSPGNAIDQALDECLATPEGATTTGQVMCLTRAYDAWDQQLNVVYRALMEKLDPASKTLLRDAQRQWLAYRDADRTFQGGPWTEDKGTIMRIILNSAAVDRVRTRTQALRDYLAVYE